MKRLSDVPVCMGSRWLGFLRTKPSRVCRGDGLALEKEAFLISSCCTQLRRSASWWLLSRPYGTAAVPAPAFGWSPHERPLRAPLLACLPSHGGEIGLRSPVMLADGGGSPWRRHFFFLRRPLLTLYRSTYGEQLAQPVRNPGERELTRPVSQSAWRVLVTPFY